MKWHSPLYIGEKAQKNKAKIIKGIEEGRIFLSTYAIVLPRESVGQLEIVQATILAQPFYKKYEPEIIGIAASKQEAIDIVCELTTTAISKTGSANVRDFLKRGDAMC